jgi:hypothetical protein
MESPLKLIAIALGLLIIGIVLPFLMVIGLIESTLLLNFLAAGCSVAGLTTGFIGITRSSRGQK